MSQQSFRLGRLDVQLAGSRLALAGRIDDGSPLGEIAAKLPHGDVAIDTGKVTFVNSIGVREWMRLVRALRERGTVTLERVSDVLVAQMNLVPGMADGVQISSFHAPYVCPACGVETAPLIDAVAHAAGLRVLQAPTVPCRDCGGQMELADFPQRYLGIFRTA